MSLTILVLLLGGLWLGSTESADKSADEFGLNYLDTSVDPCDNFYEFACGNFDKYYQRSDDEGVLDLFVLTENELVKKAQETLSVAIQDNDPDALKKAKIAYESCLDVDIYNIDNPELAIADEYGGLPFLTANNSEIQPLTWRDIGEITRKFGIQHFFQFSIQNFDPLNYILLMQLDAWEDPSLIRPAHSKSYDDTLEEEFKKSGRKQTDSLKKVFEATSEDKFNVFLMKLATKLNNKVNGVAQIEAEHVERIAKQLQDVRTFMETLFSGGIVDDNFTSIDNIPTSIAQLQNWTDAHFGSSTDMNWLEYLHEVFKWSSFNAFIDEDFQVFFTSIRDVYGVLNLVRLTDPLIIKNFIFLRTFVFLAPDSDFGTRAAFEEYYTASGYKYYDRPEYCARKILDVVDTPSLSFAAAYDFGQHYFNFNKIGEVITLIENIRKSYNTSFDSLDWIAEDSDRELFKEKLGNMFVALAYPDHAHNRKDVEVFYQNLQICRWDNYGNSKRIRAFREAYAFNEYGNNAFWDFSPFEVNARYVRAGNKIKLPLAMLQEGFFTGTNHIRDYGRLGSTIAHEIAHSFDTAGLSFDQNGFQDAWISNATRDHHSTKTQCLVNQFSSYRIPELNTTVNGNKTLDENIADTSGIRRSFAAFQGLVPPPVVPDGISYTKEQLFFISYATMWCSQESTEYLSKLTSYPPTRYRIIGSLSNSEDFANAFNCPVGSRMNPETKCPMW